VASAHRAARAALARLWHSSQLTYTEDIIMKYISKAAAAIGLVGMLASVPASAAGGWSQALTISSIEVDYTATGSETYLSFTAVPTTKPGCATSTAYALGNGQAGPADAIKAQAALANAAFLAGKQVKIYVSDTLGCDAGGIARVAYLTIQ
jgi:hypothetical protein